MKNLVKRMFHNASSCFRCSFTAETTALASQRHLSSTFFFSWVKFGELYSCETEFVFILVRQLAMSRVTMNFFLISVMFMQNNYIVRRRFVPS